MLQRLPPLGIQYRDVHLCIRQELQKRRRQVCVGWQDERAIPALDELKRLEREPTIRVILELTLSFCEQRNEFAFNRHGKVRVFEGLRDVVLYVLREGQRFGAEEFQKRYRSTNLFDANDF